MAGGSESVQKEVNALPSEWLSKHDLAVVHLLSSRATGRLGESQRVSILGHVRWPYGSLPDWFTV